LSVSTGFITPIFTISRRFIAEEEEEEEEEKEKEKEEEEEEYIFKEAGNREHLDEVSPLGRMTIVWVTIN
jgi:hypothetical protein